MDYHTHSAIVREDPGFSSAPKLLLSFVLMDVSRLGCEKPSVEGGLALSLALNEWT